jgi:hypothetical protein
MVGFNLIFYLAYNQLYINNRFVEINSTDCFLEKHTAHMKIFYKFVL